MSETPNVEAPANDGGSTQKEDKKRKRPQHPKTEKERDTTTSTAKAKPDSEVSSSSGQDQQVEEGSEQEAKKRRNQKKVGRKDVEQKKVKKKEKDKEREPEKEEEEEDDNSDKDQEDSEESVAELLHKAKVYITQAGKPLSDTEVDAMEAKFIEHLKKHDKDLPSPKGKIQFPKELREYFLINDGIGEDKEGGCEGVNLYALAECVTRRVDIFGDEKIQKEWFDKYGWESCAAPGWMPIGGEDEFYNYFICCDSGSEDYGLVRGLQCNTFSEEAGPTLFVDFLRSMIRYGKRKAKLMKRAREEAEKEKKEEGDKTEVTDDDVEEQYSILLDSHPVSLMYGFI